MNTCYTPFLKNHLLFSCGDHPGKVAVITYVNVSQCNLRCTNCHNRESVKKYGEHLTYLTLDELQKNIRNGMLMGTDMIIISGGEPTLHTDIIIDCLKELGKPLPIRMDTNGQLPNEVARLLPYVDGFAVDIKVPIKNEYTEEELIRFREIIGVDDVVKYAQNLEKTIKLVDGKELSLYRTVGYPMFQKQDKLAISEYASNLKSPHYWNPFFWA